MGDGTRSKQRRSKYERNLLRRVRRNVGTGARGTIARAIIALAIALTAGWSFVLLALVCLLSGLMSTPILSGLLP